MRVIKRLEEVQISFVEQPVEGIDRMAEVKSHVSVPIMADESCWTPKTSSSSPTEGQRI